MSVHQSVITISTEGPGTYEVTDRIAAEVRRSGLACGLVNLFCRHTSCSLVIFENADPSARADLEAWLDRLVSDCDPHFTHTAEGADDMPAHIKMALTRTAESVPFAQGRLMLGTWQGVFLWEHRAGSHQRGLVITVLGE